ncbi:histidinol-phosphate transaminase [Herbaspirillum sp. LeCh32-8]|uniref:histidinol-phosphate transaminase n=1 Tax=Herbaspirillum sp. LeCh32-8 TaxID=2821356 RepID=UPI001AE6F5DA|nr:histidinol-phosphate transaminase [Herbaspirillum sp. LeCh32-8]MBP0598264.1 histidinol-phosphate transaminase [Herbaspirillum sp. LeCh32-8]
MSKFWSPIVSRLTPYTPGEQPKIANLVKLNTNENPYGPSPRALDAIAREVSESLRLYPNPDAEPLKLAIAARHAADGITAREVFVGNGSDEVLAHAFHALLQHGKPILFPDITYSFYPTYCGLYQVEHRAVPLADDFTIRADDYLGHGDAIGGIIFPNPNAPTGCLMGLAEIERILQGNPERVVVVDEAYIDFGGDTAIPLVQRYPNLLVVQTFSKSRALAGMRVGFAIGHADLIAALERVKNSFNSYPLDRPAIAGATAAIEDEQYFRQTCDMVIASRDKLDASLTALGFEVLPSAANFVFARHPRHDAAKLAAALRGDGIIVRHFTSARINQFLRITIGTDEACGTLVDALKRHLA